MASGTAKIRFGSGATDDVAKPAVERVASITESLDAAAYAGTRESTSLLGNMAQDSIEGIAGGVYWNVLGSTTKTPHGGRGRVVTPPNRPHEIWPRPENPRNVLSWQIKEGPRAGDWVSARMVNHPGANPVYWPRGLGMFPERAERIFEREVAQALRGEVEGGD